MEMSSTQRLYRRHSYQQKSTSAQIPLQELFQPYNGSPRATQAATQSAPPSILQPSRPPSPSFDIQSNTPRQETKPPTFLQKCKIKFAQKMSKRQLHQLLKYLAAFSLTTILNLIHPVAQKFGPSSYLMNVGV